MSDIVPKTQFLRTQMTVPRIGFGGSRLHYLKSEAARQALLSAAFDSGVSYFDVAPLYGHGLAERSVGRFLTDHPSRRDDLVLSTKWGLRGSGWLDAVPQPLLRTGVMAELIRNRVFGKRSQPNLDSAELRSSVEGSLRRLRTERIDILWMHEPEAALLPRPDEVLMTLETLRSSGKIGAFGVAGYAAHINPVLGLFGDQAAGFLRQADESEWLESDPPDVTFGALSRGPQSINAPRIDGATAAQRLQAALDRRPNGSVLISTTRPENLRSLVKGIAFP